MFERHHLQSDVLQGPYGQGSQGQVLKIPGSIWLGTYCILSGGDINGIIGNSSPGIMPNFI